MESRYYSQTPEQVLAAVESREEGLTSQQAQERLERFGPNALREEKKKPVWQVFLEQIGRASVGKECRSRWSPYH